MLGTFAIAVVLSLWYLLGSSPTDIQLIGGWLAFLSGWLAHHEKKFSNFEQRFHDKLTEIEQRLHDKLLDVERRLGDKIEHAKNI